MQIRHNPSVPGLVSLLFIAMFATQLSAKSGKVYRVDSNASSALPLYEYDVATNTWLARAALPDLNTATIASDGTDAYVLPQDGMIYRYDPAGNQWVFVMAGPAASIGRHAVSMFETLEGEFYYGDDGQSTLHYTVGGVWQSVTTPRQISSGTSVDRQNSIIYVRTYRQLGFWTYDPNTGMFPSFCDDLTSVTENGRAGTFFNGKFYARSFSGNMFENDVVSCVNSDTGALPSSQHSATCEGNGLIYLNGYNSTDTVFESFDPVTRTVTPLATAPTFGGNSHTSLAFTRESVSVEITQLQATPLSVAPGSSGHIITFDADNNGMAAVNVTSVGLTFEDAGMNDVSSEYTVTPDVMNPTTIAQGATETFTFAVDVDAGATLGTITIDGEITAVDPIAMVSGGDSSATTPDTWDVIGAQPFVRSVDAIPMLVSQGATGQPVSTTVENTGLNAFTVATAGLAFTDAGAMDVTSEYVVSPDPMNPTTIAAGSTETFNFTVDVGVAATLGFIDIEGTVTGTDSVSMTVISDLDADAPDQWEVLQCNATLCGDCTGDGMITILDALVAAQHSAALTTLTGTDFTNCNVIGAVEPDPGALVTILDALSIAQFAAGLPVTLTCC